MFKLFAPHATTAMPASARPAGVDVDDERSKLNMALHLSLENLSQTYNDKRNIQRLCKTLMAATGHLRLIWIGFREDSAAQVSPYAAVGEDPEAGMTWQLPQSCFDFTGPYSQAAIESGGAASEHTTLFAPWQQDIDACPASCALAIPLRAERSDERASRGLMVFYGDDIDYFSRMGIAPFQALAHVAEIIWQQASLMQMLKQKAQRDTLTGLMNRSKLLYLLEQALVEAGKKRETLSVIMCRIDHFDQVSATAGWVAADAMLVECAQVLQARSRPQDSLGRWSSAEFLYLMPRTSAQQAQIVAQGLQAYFLSHPQAAGSQAPAMQLLVGVATSAHPVSDAATLIQQASQKMRAQIDAQG